MRPSHSHSRATGWISSKGTIQMRGCGASRSGSFGVTQSFLSSSPGSSSPGGRSVAHNAYVAERVRDALGVVSHVDGRACLLYTSDAADDLLCVDLGGRR